MGGPRMAEAGVELIADYHEVAVVGIAEVLHKIPTVVRVQNRLAREAKKRGANLAILVDSPGTHLGVARRLKNDGIPVGYFIGPQVWAWRAGRVRVVKRLVKRMVVIFPFEEKIYRDAGVPVDFVGHPLVDVVPPTHEPRRSSRRGTASIRRGPSSRSCPAAAEAKSRGITRTVIEACERLHRSMTGPPHPIRSRRRAKSQARNARRLRADPAVEIKRVEGDTYNALAAADCAIVASGTATVEAALLGTPMVVIYRVTPITAGDSAPHDPHALYRHGEPDRGPPGGARADSGRFHAAKPWKRSAAAAGIGRSPGRSEGRPG